MKRTTIVMFRDLKELWKSVAFKVMILVFFLLMIGANIVVTISINNIYNEVKMLDSSTVVKIMEDVLTKFGIVIPLYFLTMIPFIVFVWVFVYAIMGKEKASGNLETLLATPLRPMAIAFGKSFAIFIPGLIISIVLSLLAILSLNIITGIIVSSVIVVIPLPAIVTCLVVNPIQFLAFIMLTNILALAKNPDIAIIPSFPLGFGLMLGIPIGLGLEVIDLGSWTFILYYSLGALVMWVITAILFGLLDKEKIILSGRNG